MPWQATLALLLVCAASCARTAHPATAALAEEGRAFSEAHACDMDPPRMAWRLLSYWLEDVEAAHGAILKAQRKKQQQHDGQQHDGQQQQSEQQQQQQQQQQQRRRHLEQQQQGGTLAASTLAAPRQPVRDVESILEEHGVLSGKDYCMFRVHFDPATHRFTYEPRKECVAFAVRVEVLTTLLTYVSSRRPGLLHGRTAFSFLFDPTAASRNHPQLFGSLRQPMLSLSRSPADRFTVPVPHYHQQLAMFRLDNATLFSLLPQALQQSADGYYDIHSLATPPVPWSNKIEKVVYRGGCLPTLSPFSTDHDQYIFLRAELCEFTGGDALFDVGTYTGGALNPFELCDGPDKQHRELFASMCNRCRLCSRRPKLSAVELSQYRYQIYSDGFGAASDSMFWKLGSGSVVLWQLPAKSSEPAWLPWFYPGLRAYRDYVPSAAEDMAGALKFCIYNDDACHRMSVAARRNLACKANLYVALEYFAHLLRYLECLAEQPAAAAGPRACRERVQAAVEEA